MNLRDTLVWNEANIPEYVLENMWKVIINDSPQNSLTMNSKLFFTDNILDNAIADIEVPQEEVEFEKTEFGLPVFKELKDYSTVTISYYDYVNTLLGGSMPITKFFQTWLDCIYDRNNHTIMNNWRNEGKDIEVSINRYLRKKSLLANLASSASNQFGTIAGSVGIKVPVNVSDITEITCVSYRLANCYPTKINQISLSTEGGDRLKMSVELICERVVPTFG